MQRELFKYVKDVQVVEREGIEEALRNARSMPGSHVDESIDLDAVINNITDRS